MIACPVAVPYVYVGFHRPRGGGIDRFGGAHTQSIRTQTTVLHFHDSIHTSRGTRVNPETSFVHSWIHLMHLHLSCFEF
mgnify:CR=1 FL=1